jgi:undecaprenyl diphosphate synthase
MSEAEVLTAANTRLVTNIAVNYGGRWDITQAAIQMAKAVADGCFSAEDIDEDQFAHYLALASSADPDLFIRTGGEMRVSNFLLWQSAYTEFYFTPVLWPDFDKKILDLAIAAFQSRERRYGRTSDQVKDAGRA